MIAGTKRFKNVTQEQVNQIKRRCHKDFLSVIGKSIGLREQRVGEIIKALGIPWERKRKRCRPFEALYNILVGETKRRTSGPTTVELSYKQFVDFTSTKVCHYCGADIYWAEYVNREEGGECTNLDRKNNLLGYTKDNCVVCCGNCNRTKGARFTYEEFMLLAPGLREIQTRRKQYDNNRRPQ